MEFKNEKELLRSLLEKAQEKNLIGSTIDINEIIEGVRTENQYILCLSTIAYILSELTGECEEIYNSFNIDTAVGVELDKLGALVNMPRIDAQPAFVDLEISVPVALEYDLTIPAGTSVILESVFNGYALEYVTSTDAVLKGDTLKTSVQAETLDKYYQVSIPEGAVVGLEGFGDLDVINPSQSTNGRNVEEDAVYRERIKNWVQRNIRGTRACYENYLLNYPYLNDFKLLPCFDGIGTLKIISDIPTSKLNQLKEDVVDNCSLFTDETVVCVTPESMGIGTTVIPLELTITIDTGVVQDYNLFSQLLRAQSIIYFTGGVSQLGESVTGLHIGDNFYPSQLFNYLSKQFNKEILHISYNDEEAPIYVNDGNYKLRFDGYSSLILKDVEGNTLYPTE